MPESIIGSEKRKLHFFSVSEIRKRERLIEVILKTGKKTPFQR